MEYRSISRFERGQVLAVSAHIQKVREIPSSIAGPLTVWSVESERIHNKYYMVVEKDDGFVCNCPDYTNRGEVCKHAFAVLVRETT